MSAQDATTHGVQDHQDLVDVPGPLGAALPALTVRGWQLAPVLAPGTGCRTGAAVVFTGPGGVLVVGTVGTPDEELARRAADVCALIPAPLRRYLRVEGGHDCRSIVSLADEAQAAVHLAGAEIACLAACLAVVTTNLTVDKVLEWTRDARPEPARAQTSTRAGRASAWFLRHGVALSVIAVVTALMSVFGPGSLTSAPNRADTTASAVVSKAASPTSTAGSQGPVGGPHGSGSNTQGALNTYGSGS